jgi:photosystem II stability/assembly factor-like uncharacterized protein
MVLVLRVWLLSGLLVVGCGDGGGGAPNTPPRAWLTASRGTGNVLMRSDDQGETWEDVFAPSGRTSFIDREHGWMAGRQIMRTDDGGRSFSPQPVQLPADQSSQFRDVAFADIDHGVAVGFARRDGETFARELAIQTDDGGATWREPSFDGGAPGFGGLGDTTLSAACVSATGIRLAVGGGGINVANHASAFASEARGERWHFVGDELIAAGGGYLEGAFSGVACVGTRELWVVGSRHRRLESAGETEPLTILHSSDGGNSWENQASRTPLGSVDAAIESIAFADPRHAWAVGYEGRGSESRRPLILHTVDGGVHWDQQALPGDPMDGRLAEVAFATSTDGLIIGRTHEGAPLMFATIDGGRRWSAVRLPSDVEEVFDVSYVR